MALTPERYFYLQDESTGKVLAVFSADHCKRELEVITLEARIRARHGVDDLDSGILLRDSLDAPLSAEVARKATRGRLD